MGPRGPRGPRGPISQLKLSPSHPGAQGEAARTPRPAVSVAPEGEVAARGAKLRSPMEKVMKFIYIKYVYIYIYIYIYIYNYNYHP